MIMKVFSIVLAVLALCQLSRGYYDRDYESNRDRYRNMERKVDRLEAKVEILTNELLSEAENAPCPKYEEIPDTLPADYPEILPLEARKEPLENDEIRLTLKFWTSRPFSEVTTKWQRSLFAPFEEVNAYPVEPNQAESRMTIAKGNASSLTVAVAAGTSKFTFEFNTTTAEHKVQTCIPLPTFRKEPPGDIVYDPGHDVRVVLTVPPEYVAGEGTPDDYYTNLHVTPYLVDLVTGGVMTRIEDDNFASDMTSENFLASQKITAQLHTASRSVSGYISFTMEDGRRESHLISRVQRAVEVVLRPSNQTGAFPPGYVNFLVEQNTHVSPSGIQTVLCERNSVFPTVCYAGCGVVGTELTELRVFHFVNGTPSIMTNIESVAFMEDAWKAAYFIVNDTGNPVEVFQCVALNEAGHSATRDIYVSFYDAAEINTNLTGYRLINNSVAALTCVAEGTPQINISFDLGYGQEPADDVEEENNMVIATKFTEVNFRYGNYYNFECRVYQNLPDGEERERSHMIEVTRNGNQLGSNITSNNSTDSG